MANNWRKTLISASLIMVTNLVGCAAREGEPRYAATADSASATAGPVRSDDPELRLIIANAQRRSATFRDVTAAIAKTDGVVYVENARCGRGVRACLVMGLTVAGPYRYLRVRLAGRASDDGSMASLGHELRHALEILSEPGIRSGEAMYLFYKRFGTWVGDAFFETAAAVAAGDAIRVELRGN
jgi:hypothetical protein